MHTISDTVERKFINSINLDNLEIETDSGWQPVTSIHKTVPYTVWSLKTKSGLILDCADTHIIFDEEQNEIFVKDVVENKTKILTVNGPELVTLVKEKSHQENMFDVTVDSADHRFYTNGILSHNTTIINALSYVIYGVALTNIKRDNLINKINSKGMLVTVAFEKNGVNYRIERGRKPNVLKFIIDGHEHIADNSDESQGDSRETQKAIEEVFGMGHTMFKHLVALNTYTEPFLSLKSGEQRQIIEELLGITLLSEKADALKERMKVTRDAIANETTRIDTIKASNDRIQQSINSLIRKQQIWNQQRDAAVQDLALKIADLETMDIEAEITAQRELENWLTQKKDFDMLSSSVARQVASHERELRSLEKLEDELAVLKEKKCHSCGQELHDDHHNDMLARKELQVSESKKSVDEIEAELTELSSALNAIGEPGKRPQVHYNSLEEALNHRSTLEALEKQLLHKNEEVNPYNDQIDELQNSAVQEVDWTPINDLNRVKEHQEFLYKLLTNKDSFVRKRIIDQNLAFLNQRLTYYLDKVGLPHVVEFQNDLSVTITQLGQDLDFDNLSRGERNRLILSMSWSFRDVWESLYHGINLVFVDELIDSGMDSSGVELSLGVLKRMVRERKKSVFLISHREDLVSRVNRVLRVIKENGFTSYDPDVEVVG